MLRRFIAYIEPNETDYQPLLIDKQTDLFTLDKRNCGSRIKLIATLVLVGCAKNNMIEVFLRDDMNRMTIIDNWILYGQMGEHWNVIEHLNGKQVFLFVPVKPLKVDDTISLFYVEFIINKWVYSDYQYIYMAPVPN